MEPPVVGSIIDGLKIKEVGQIREFNADGHLLPVQFEDGTYAILEWNGARAPKVWVSDNKNAAQAIHESVEMPQAVRGAGSGVINVLGVDCTGKYRVHLFYNSKKQLGYEDQLLRY